MKAKCKGRQSNFEFLRIVAMLMVISLHYLGHGGVLYNADIFSVNFFVSNLIESLCIFAVNIYVLISAYFLCDSKVNYKKIIKLWSQVSFYTIGIYIIISLITDIKMNPLDLIKSIFPIVNMEYGFVSAYFILVIISPFINKLINSLNKREYSILLVTILIIFNVLGIQLPIASITYSYFGNFVVLYLIAGYIKKYLNEFSLKKKHITVVFVGCVLAIFIGRILLYKINRGDIAYLLLKYNCVFVMGGSIALFILFKSIDLGVNKKINYISSLTFGVYLIHDNRYIRGILYDNILNTQRWFNSNYLIIDFIIG